MSVHVRVFDRLAHREDGKLSEPDCIVSNDLRSVTISKRLTRRQCIEIGIAIGEKRERQRKAVRAARSGDVAPGPVSPMSFVQVPLLEHIHL